MPRAPPEWRRLREVVRRERGDGTLPPASGTVNPRTHRSRRSGAGRPPARQTFVPLNRISTGLTGIDVGRMRSSEDCRFAARAASNADPNSSNAELGIRGCRPNLNVPCKVLVIEHPACRTSQIDLPYRATFAYDKPAWLSQAELSQAEQLTRPARPLL